MPITSDNVLNHARENARQSFDDRLIPGQQPTITTLQHVFIRSVRRRKVLVMGGQ